MKKFLFVLVVLLMFSSAYAQQQNMADTAISQDNRTWINEKYKEMFKYPITVSGYGFFNSSALAVGRLNGATYGIDGHLGGGGAITAKISFFRWLALALDVSYSGATRSEAGATSTFGTFLFSPMIVFQRETLRGQAGFVPWVGLGFSISNNSWTMKGEDYYGQTYTDSISRGGFGFIFNAGVKYNMKNNVFVGVRTDYSASSFENTTMNNWRLGVEAGYRF